MQRETEDGAEFMDLCEVDEAAFPESRNAVPAVADLGPGDVVYIPRKWPHWVCALEDSVSLTENFLTPFNKKDVRGKLERFATSKTQCEALLGRPLSTRDNLLNLCVHGGNIHYGNVKKPSDDELKTE